MAKLLGLDIGGKRTGMAETDGMQMMAFPLKTVATDSLVAEVGALLAGEKYEAVVIGLPRRLHGELSDVAELVQKEAEKLTKAFPDLQQHWVDERYTSSMASAALVAGGMKKSKRQEKGAVDKVAAALILENFLALR